MKKVKSISKIVSFHFWNSTLITLGDKVAFYAKNLKLTDEFDEKVWYSTLFKKVLLFQNENGKEIKYIKLDDKMMGMLYGGYYLFKNWHTTEAIFIANSENKVIEFDSNLNVNAIYSFGRFPFAFYNRHFFRRPPSKIIAQILGTETESWFMNIGCQSEGEAIFYQNLVIVCAKDDIMRAFDVETGTLVWQCADVFAFNLFLAEDFIYCLSGEWYKKIDAKTGIMIVSLNIYERDKCGHMYFQVGKANCFDGENIYFSGQDSSKVGAFNTNTLKIEWLYELPKPEKYMVSYFLERPQYHNGKVYVLDSEHMLHIFEK